MTSEHIIMSITILVYLAGMLWVGVLCSKQNKDTTDFYLGGRKLGPLVTAMSAEASDMSSWLLMGLPGLAYLTGVADAGWTAIGLAIGTYINWFLVAKRLRVYTHIAGNAITLPDFFHNRYRDKSRLLMLFSSLMIVLFFIPYTASGFAACGKLFSSLFGVDYTTAMVVSAIVIVGYTATGGFLAASTTDFIQSLVMSVALVLVLLFGVHTAGGWSVVMERAAQLPGYLGMFQTHQPETGTAVTYPTLSMFSTIAWGLGYFGMPHILLRFMAIEDKEKLTLSRRIATIWVVISLAVGVTIGIVGMAMTKTGVLPVLQGASSETILVVIADLMSKNGWLLAIFAGLILAGILASIMSTADSQLLAASSSVSQNLLQGVFQVSINKKAEMLCARGTLIAIALLGMWIAKDPNSSIFGIVSFAWAGFGACFGPVVIMALFWKRSNRWGALTGMLVGGTMVFVWKYLVIPLGGFWNIYELLPAFVAACVAIVVVSLLTAPPEKEICVEFDKVCKECR